MASARELILAESNDNNKVGTIESILAGVGSGLLAIPKGFFSLGATLLDLGVDQNRAARVEAFFDDLTTLDEKAEATVAGQITEALVNIGIPATAGFRVGSKIAVDAMKAAKTGKYFKPSRDVKKLADDVLELNTKGKTNRFIGGALGGGVGEATFVGDVEQIGTFGDLIGGPTEIDRETDDPLQDLLNRVKFGGESLFITPIVYGVGRGIKEAATMGKNIEFSNSKLSRFFNSVFSAVRARGAKPQKIFEEKMAEKGATMADTNEALQLVKEIDKIVGDGKFDVLIRPVSSYSYKTKGGRAGARVLDEIKWKYLKEDGLVIQSCLHHMAHAYTALYCSPYDEALVVTIDGGEWLQGAGQFNQMEAISEKEWDILEKIIRSNQKKS